jgi:glycosyltransferase involved in cell wall biosynthesis
MPPRTEAFPALSGSQGPARPLRVALDCRLLQWPGVGRYLRELAAALVPAAPDLQFFWLCSQARAGELPCGPTAQPVVLRSSPFRLAEQLELPLQLRALHIDLLHAPVSHAIPLAAPRFVVTLHDLVLQHFPEFLPSRLAGAYYRAMNHASVRRARRVIAVSEFTRADAASAWPRFASKLVTIPNGVSSHFRPVCDAGERSALCRALALPPRYVLYLGTWKRHKNLPRLLQAYGKLDGALRERFPLVVVARSDPRYPEVEAAAHAAGIHGEVLWRADIEEGALPALYSMARCVVLPSLYEGFGLPVAEGFACGTPALVSRAGALPEIGGDACLTSDPCDPASIAEGLFTLLTDDTLQRELSARALARARAFSWEKAAERVAALYREVLHG